LNPLKVRRHRRAAHGQDPRRREAVLRENLKRAAAAGGVLKSLTRNGHCFGNSPIRSRTRAALFAAIPPLMIEVRVEK
jgi:hypothetical protein